MTQSRKARPGNATVTEIDPTKPMQPYPGKSCGGCTACCSTVPVKEIGLGAFIRCQHLRSPAESKIGCSIYQTRPRSCLQWACTWLISDLPDEFKPNRIGVVVDPIPDMVRVYGEELVAAQLWVVPGHEEDWRDKPAVIDLIRSIFRLGFAVLWRIKGEGDGTQLARVMIERDGKQFVSEPTLGQKEITGFANDGERLRRAQGLLGATQ